MSKKEIPADGVIYYALERLKNELDCYSGGDDYWRYLNGVQGAVSVYDLNARVEEIMKEMEEK